MAFRSRRIREKEQVRQPSVQTETNRYLFRRSRTLTGSSSAQVISANETGSQLISPRHKTTGLKARRRRIGLLLVASLSVVIFVAWLFDQLITAPTIVFQPSSVTASHDRYQQLVQDYLNEHPLERFQFALNRDQFSYVMVQRAPELASAVLRNEAGIMSASVVLGARQPVAGWQIGDRQYLVDSSGISFEKNLLADPKISVRDMTGLPAVSQQIIASTKMMTFIGRVVGGVEAQLGTVKEIVIPSGTLKEVDLLFDDRPYLIKLNIDREPLGQVADIIAAVQHIQARGITPQYVDVRVEGKAFYKQ